MKKPFLTFLTMICLFASGLNAADSASAPKEKYYGKITSINLAQKNLVVHNAKKNEDAQFQWDSQTGVTANKKQIAPAELKVGQSLYIAYMTENDLKKATAISVRTPFKKAQPQ